MADLVYPPVVGICKTAFKAMDLRIDLKGQEHVPRRGGAVLVSNHISYLDFVFCGYAARPAKRFVRFMTKESVFRHRASGPLLRAMKHIPVDRAQGGQAFAHALRALRSGEVVGVFPEATISQSFTLKSFKSGAARLAQQAGVPLLPMAVWGTQRIWTKGRTRDFGRNHLPITLRLGAPVPTGDGVADAPAGADHEDAEKLTERLKGRIQELLEAAQGAYPDRPRGPGDDWWQPAHLGGSAPAPGV
ncbi:1-acyl-sn-glycerol-3-phosphate acyltransferase [Streptomyces sp. NBC_01808]|uniref:lysophospholipid acyltransferase family protein n=1 Tax=Streptomyces sp. NBC_01808 TaxID=2975947 RepID=UPI002DD9DB70|nr:lysophospholipid acyltransferase family protein [Streptomyces sp. NBC_01808]WSA36460.1 1-acyl-sn-glycerol-3-phosphate acyltransferase [Streptomyces sp. NBC_01808]